MRMESHYTFDLPRKLVWKWIKDEHVLRNSITGCKTFHETSTGVYRTEIDIQFGPIKDSFLLTIQQIEETKLSFIRLEFNGKGKLGETKGKSDLFFNDSQGTTKLTIKTDVQLMGTLAIASERLSEGEVNKFIGNFLGKLEKEIKKAIYQSRRRGR